MGGRGLRGSRYTYRLGRHLYEGGLGARGSSLLTHTTLCPIPRRRSRISLYNRLCARSIVTHCRGMGYKIPLWGKGLNVTEMGKNICGTLFCTVIFKGTVTKFFEDIFGPAWIGFNYKKTSTGFKNLKSLFQFLATIINILLTSR